MKTKTALTFKGLVTEGETGMSTMEVVPSVSRRNKLRTKSFIWGWQSPKASEMHLRDEIGGLLLRRLVLCSFSTSCTFKKLLCELR